MIRGMAVDSGYQRPGSDSGFRNGSKTGPRTPPPEATGAEARYLTTQMEARTPMTFRLVGGEHVRGVIEYYDRDIIKVVRSGAAGLILRKEIIVYMHKDGSERGKKKMR